MQTPPLPPRLHEILLQHLQTEEQVLLRMQGFAETVNGAGFQLRILAEQQAGLSQLMGDLFAVQMQRQALFGAIARLWGCSPDLVSLSRIRVEPAAAGVRLEERRRGLAELAQQAQAGMRTAESTLRGWSGITNFVLGELLGSSGSSDRYTANGQRMSSPRVDFIDVRT